MTSIEQSALTSMDGTDEELFPYLPYILQDIWEIGTDPDIIIELIKKHAKNYSKLNVLDLGCGKGAVTIRIAHELNSKCFGIDAVKEFIDAAKNKSVEYGVDQLCKFVVNDIRKSIKKLPQFDIIILGAIGPVFGDYFSTLKILSKCINPDGIIIIDDGYIERDNDYTHPLILNKQKILHQIKSAGMSLIDEVIIQKDEIKQADDLIFSSLKKRCLELIMKYPGKKQIFENYIKNQETENYVLENKVVCSTMLIKIKY